MNKHHRFNIEQLRKDVALGQRPLRITSHAQVEAFKDEPTAKSPTSVKFMVLYHW